MLTVTFCGASYTCDVALKGTDYVLLLDASGKSVASFNGISDFSGFSISGGIWTTPKTAEDCNVAVVHEDGSVSPCGRPMKQFMISDMPFGGTVVLTKEVQYGTELPATGVEGQLFFKINE